MLFILQKWRLRQRCFPVNYEKNLRAPILKNTRTAASEISFEEMLRQVKSLESLCTYFLENALMVYLLQQANLL